jgi:hypothetical protein
MGLSVVLLGTFCGCLWEHIENKKIQHPHSPPPPPKRKKKTLASSFLIIMKFDKVFPKRKNKIKNQYTRKTKIP